MIVITGGTGFIGSVLAWKFNSMGVTNLILVDQNVSCPIKKRNINKRSFIDCLESDAFLQNLESGSYGDKIQAIFHMGACSSTTEMDTVYLQKNNLEYSQRIAQCCLKYNIYLSYASTTSFT